MKLLKTSLLIFTVSTVNAEIPKENYPSCDLAVQPNIDTQVGKLHNHDSLSSLEMRMNILQADISNARKSRLLTETQATKMWTRVNKIRTNIEDDKNKKIISSDFYEKYNNVLDKITFDFCHSNLSIHNTNINKYQKLSATTEQLIIYYNPQNKMVKKHILNYAKSADLPIIYDLKNMNAIVIGNIDMHMIDNKIKDFEAISGVIIVNKNEFLQPQNSKID